MRRGALALVALLLAACHGGQEITVTSGAGAAFEPALAVQGNELLLAWHDDRTRTDQIFLRRYDATLAPLSGELQLTQGTNPAYEADVVFLGERAAVAWYEAARDGSASVQVALWDTASGQQLWQRKLGNAARSRIPVLAASGERLFIAWMEDVDLRPANPPRSSTIWQAWLNADGALLAAPTPLATASPTTWNLNATPFDAETVALVYDSSHATQAPELYLTLAHAEAPGATWRLSRDDGIPSTYPDLAVNGETLALTWFDTVANNSDVSLRLFQKPLLNENTDSLDVDLEAQAITRTPGASIGAYLAWCEDVLGLVLVDDSSGTQQLFLQLFNETGTALGAMAQLTNSRTDSTIPAIKGGDRSFLLSWSESNLNGHATNNGILMLRRVPLP
ncbi:MAG TPA: hypothetical protein VNR18_13860 [Hyphomicrobiales bacterium]|nr:hypothetical protein [Hyphomicrobiales bacterium]